MGVELKQWQLHMSLSGIFASKISQICFQHDIGEHFKSNGDLGALLNYNLDWQITNFNCWLKKDTSDHFGLSFVPGAANCQLPSQSTHLGACCRRVMLKQHLALRKLIPL